MFPGSHHRLQLRQNPFIVNGAQRLDPSFTSSRQAAGIRVFFLTQKAHQFLRDKGHIHRTYKNILTGRTVKQTTDPLQRSEALSLIHHRRKSKTGESFRLPARDQHLRKAAQFPAQMPDKCRVFPGQKRFVLPHPCAVSARQNSDGNTVLLYQSFFTSTAHTLYSGILAMSSNTGLVT